MGANVTTVGELAELVTAPAAAGEGDTLLRSKFTVPRTLPLPGTLVGQSLLSRPRRAVARLMTIARTTCPRVTLAMAHPVIRLEP